MVLRLAPLQRALAASAWSARLLTLAAAPVLGCDGDEPGAAPPQLEKSERLPGGQATNELLLGSSAFKMVVPNVTEEHEAQFFTGNSFFNSAWVQAPASTTARDGLGPLFNARSCSACHLQDGRGAPPAETGDDFVGLLLRLGTGKLDARGAPEGDPRYGGQLQTFALEGVPVEARARVSYETQAGTYEDGEAYELLVPTYSLDELAYGEVVADLRISPRVAPVMVGLGLLEAIAEADLLALADAGDSNGDGISGRPNLVFDWSSGQPVPGRFGWKAEQPSVRQQVAGAFVEDLGITNPVFSGEACSSAQRECAEEPSGGKPEISDDLFDKVGSYSSLLAVPVRERWRDDDILAGRALFHAIGCATCHTPRHTTGTSAFGELAEQTIWPYTDLLLHDMGDALGDARPAFAAEGNEWRTPPLWGLGRISDVNGHERLLHDGRARGVAEAILWHGGEASEASERFRRAGKRDRDLLVQFVRSL